MPITYTLLVSSGVTLATLPSVIKYAKSLRKQYDKVQEMVPVMEGFVTYGRITGALFVASFLIGMTFKMPQ